MAGVKRAPVAVGYISRLSYPASKEGPILISCIRDTQMTYYTAEWRTRVQQRKNKHDVLYKPRIDQYFRRIFDPKFNPR